ncbi:hypothetical protein [Methylophaga sp. OBS4]|uniref:hypothetical protein n=1 Tax=Methylophaga sp. OBS4 TaxID=2991935 RepID=UPI002257356E|nr:hypothetical protein [Methylophaga sp. OBS4]MCX4186462.1 hypothetical protein [Methylophaga sp. OBS4]
MNDWLYLLLIPALLLVVWFWPEQKNKAPSSTRRERSSARANQYHAVSIEPGADACDAVSALGGKRFLAAEAMPLPLSACDAIQCKCTYKHYADRRKGEDRRHASTVMEHIYSKQEHRTGIDRRRQHVYQ